MKNKLSLFCLALFLYGCSFIYAGNSLNIAVIFSSDIKPYQEAYEGFVGFLKEKKSGNLAVSQYNLKNQEADAVLQQINGQKPDIIFSIGTDALKFAKKHTTNIPVIFSMVLNSGTNTAPNITGIVLDIPAETKIKAIKKILGNKKKIGIIYSPNLDSVYAETSQICGRMGMKLVGIQIDSIKDFESALNKMLGEIDCFLMLPDSNIYFDKSIEYLLVKCFENKVPVIGLSSSYTKAGALFSLDCDFKDIGRQSGEIAMRIMNDEKIGDLPVAFPEKTTLSLNLIAAEKMEIMISEETIKDASVVIK
jgi:putative tryptophan/tyrosine transport system substrate-binding protein